jgi:O-antigen/teichoic acid export membrane protein
VSSLQLHQSSQALTGGAAAIVPVQVLSGLSFRANFLWMLAGNVIFAGCQLGMIVALAKLGSSVMVGQFSLGLAIATPVLMFTNLHLRAVQATDATRLYSFGEYLQLRFVMSSLAIAAIVIFTWIENIPHRTAMVVVAVALAKGTETLSDVHYGLFQLHDRLDQTGRSMMLRGVVSLVALSAGLYLTRDVFWGSIAIALVWLAALIGWDFRQSCRFLGCSPQFRHLPDITSLWRAWSGRQRVRRQWSLVRLAVPLGMVTTLASINLNMPRYFIAAKMSEYELGVFSALAYATIGLTLVSDSLGSCAIPRLARLYAGGHIVEFQAVLLKLGALSGGLGIAALATAQLAGKRLLALLFGAEYAASSRAFVLLMLAAAIYCVAGVLTSGITAARRFRIQVPMFAAVAAVTAGACYVLVPSRGLTGAALGMTAGAVVRVLLASAALVHQVLAPWKRAGETDAHQGQGLPGIPNL